MRHLVDGLPPLLSCKSLVQKGKHFGDVELDIFEIKLILVVLLHLQQIVQLKIELQESSVAACISNVSTNPRRLAMFAF